MVELIGKTESRWGEGPVWHEEKLLFVDIEGHTIRRLDPGPGDEEVWEIGERVGLVVPRESGGWVYGGDSGLVAYDPNTGKKTPIADPEPDKKPQNRFNDGKIDPQGRLWAGTISTIKETGDAALYCLDTDLSLGLKVPEVTNSNGLAWNAAGDTFFYIDTPTKTVRAFDFDGETGQISNSRVAIDTSPWEGSPDGMCIDENDHLWINFCRGSAVHCFDPVTAKCLETLELPVSGGTSCCFGGPDLEELYITTGRFPNVDEELAGHLFVAEPGVRGTPSQPFRG
ncbi:MAG: SMP-30/gluconolactonase/LRE family protein [Verrucomicrobiota bacterium]